MTLILLTQYLTIYIYEKYFKSLKFKKELYYWLIEKFSIFRFIEGIFHEKKDTFRHIALDIEYKWIY